MRLKNRFHINGLALSLALKQRLGATQKWPTVSTSKQVCKRKKKSKGD